jgi:hypothetical protein
VQVVIATDHYAEATPLIIGRLADWQIEAKPLSDAISGEKNPFLIANSSDLGAHKADVRFWQQIRDKSAGQEPFRLLLIDDFGANEDSSDPYGDSAKVLARQEDTGRVLREVFPDDVEIHPFIVAAPTEANNSDEADKDRLYGLHISRAVADVRSFLRRGETND